MENVPTYPSVMESDRIATEDVEMIIKQLEENEREAKSLMSQLAPMVLTIENDFSRVNSLRRDLKQQIGPVYNRIIDADRRESRHRDEDQRRRY